MMDVKPPTPSSPSVDGVTARRKHRGVPLTATEKEMVMNVFNYIYSEKELECEIWEKKRLKNVSAVKTADILKLARSTVFRVLQEYKENQCFSSPKRVGPKRTVIDKLGDSTLLAIHQKVQQIFDRLGTPTLQKVLEAVNDDPDLPSFKKTTLNKVLKHLKFKFTNNKTKGQVEKSQHCSASQEDNFSTIYIKQELVEVEVELFNA